MPYRVIFFFYFCFNMELLPRISIRDGHDFDFEIKIMILISKSWF